MFDPDELPSHDADPAPRGTGADDGRPDRRPVTPAGLMAADPLVRCVAGLVASLADLERLPTTHLLSLVVAAEQAARSLQGIRSALAYEMTLSAARDHGLAARVDHDDAPHDIATTPPPTTALAAQAPEDPTPAGPAGTGPVGTGPVAGRRSGAGWAMADWDLVMTGVTDDIAVAAGVSGFVAGGWITAGQALAERLPATRAAFATGCLDWMRVQVLAARTAVLSPAQAQAVEAIVLPRIAIGEGPWHLRGPLPEQAPHDDPRHVLAEAVAEVTAVPARRRRARVVTRRGVDTEVTRAILQVDPAGAADRAQRARRSRDVVAVPLEETLARIEATLPVEHVARIMARLAAAVAAAKTAHDPRSAGEVRADTLTALLLTEHPTLLGSLTGWHHEPTTDTHDTRDSGPTRDDDTTHANDLTGAPDTPETQPPQPPPSPQPRQPEPRSPEPRSPEPRSPDGDPAETDPPPSTAGSHVPPPSPPSSSPPSSSPTPTPSSDASARSWLLPSVPGFDVLITISLETLLALDDHPAELAGYGPIPATLARDLTLHGTWRCAATDPDHGTLLGLGHRTYTPRWTPTRRLKTFVHHAHRHCSYPGCTTTAPRCDLDHIHPWRPHNTGGPTCSCNTHPLCRRHHRLKTAGMIHLTTSTNPHHPHGTLLWTTTSGRRYITTPTPIHDPTPTDLTRYRPWPPTTPTTPTTPEKPPHHPTPADPPPF